MSIADELQGISPTRRRGKLTPREIQIIERMAQGQTNQTIAIDLGISTQSVKNKVSVILGKLDAEDRAHAVAIYIRQTEQVDLQSLRNACDDMLIVLSALRSDIAKQMRDITKQMREIDRVPEPPIGRVYRWEEVRAIPTRVK